VLQRRPTHTGTALLPRSSAARNVSRHGAGKGKVNRTKFESGWEVGVIKAFEKKAPLSVKDKDDPN
jgi:hypothetical protein